MNLHYYQSNSGKNLIFEYIDSLPTDEQVDGYSVLKCLEDGKMEQVRFKRWEKKIYEVYFYKHNRIFYVTIDADNMYLLHACRKQKNKTEKKDKKIVEARAKELGNEIGKSFI
ncbi:MAG: type II toxin-antitoxin system RelE/ParE family toxin [Eubacteriales bacterium]|nr:type II toxin-antitoxin system RelE/ParE family toxin [Eubacteriales bacterium]